MLLGTCFEHVRSKHVSNMLGTSPKHVCSEHVRNMFETCFPNIFISRWNVVGDMVSFADLCDPSPMFGSASSAKGFGKASTKGMSGKGGMDKNYDIYLSWDEMFYKFIWIDHNSLMNFRRIIRFQSSDHFWKIVRKIEIPIFHKKIVGIF